MSPVWPVVSVPALLIPDKHPTWAETEGWQEGTKFQQNIVNLILEFLGHSFQKVLVDAKLVTWQFSILTSYWPSSNNLHNLADHGLTISNLPLERHLMLCLVDFLLILLPSWLGLSHTFHRTCGHKGQCRKMNNILLVLFIRHLGQLLSEHFQLDSLFIKFLLESVCYFTDRLLLLVVDII